MAHIDFEKLVRELPSLLTEEERGDVDPEMALCITFCAQPRQAVRSEVFDSVHGTQLIVDFDRDGRVISIEFH